MNTKYVLESDELSNQQYNMNSLSSKESGLTSLRMLTSNQQNIYMKNKLSPTRDQDQYESDNIYDQVKLVQERFVNLESK